MTEIDRERGGERDLREGVLPSLRPTYLAVCVCVRARARAPARARWCVHADVFASGEYSCVFVCVCVRARGARRAFVFRVGGCARASALVRVWACVYVCVRARGYGHYYCYCCCFIIIILILIIIIILITHTWKGAGKAGGEPCRLR